MKEELFRVTLQAESRVVEKGHFPSFLHRKLPKGNKLSFTQNVLSKNRLHTVCEEARCPNLLECWSKRTATFLAMGKSCTRSCGFCSIDFKKVPPPLDKEEPRRIAESCKELGLKHVVITQVARDDLADGGAGHLVRIIEEIRKECPKVTVEVLTSDFGGNFAAIDQLLVSQIEIFNHNIETVRVLSPRVRHKATYDRTLSVLSHVHTNAPKLYIKSGLMLGLGESFEQVEETLRDLKSVGCHIVTMGQYLQPDRRKLLVKEFISLEKFKEYEELAKKIGIPFVYASPFMRSSYNAASFFNNETG